ncbi:RNA 2',3'-cyclic phosphodiesterase [Erythrobacter litoralis]|uniref:RNA 2',3'-cyclic phosphodiesterase n=1 Tax=Erythrobacter litoralis TaxID=39960 RepID=UPI002435948D|nr:RNA 2',3'-cyclic phosphodiesterase [Erythrobacter litoralis]MDG6078432.1 RNA 2',3'-cyclic phosphodiesterase [Erythrobacter litoralis]
MSHRLFVAIRPPEPVRDALIDLMEGVSDVRWQDDDQLHLTLRYIGETDRHRANELAGALAAVEFAPFPIAIDGTAFFERKGRAHTLYADIDPNPELLSLRKRVERVCVQCGCEPEHRKYAPHITIARLNASSGSLTPFLGRTSEFKLAPWICDAFRLYESHLRPGGSLYEPVMTYPAAKQ